MAQEQVGTSYWLKWDCQSPLKSWPGGHTLKWEAQELPSHFLIGGVTISEECLPSRSQEMLKNPRPFPKPQCLSLCTRGTPVSLIPFQGLYSPFSSSPICLFTNKAFQSATDSHCFISILNGGKNTCNFTSNKKDAQGLVERCSK